MQKNNGSQGLNNFILSWWLEHTSEEKESAMAFVGKSTTSKEQKF